MTSPNTESDKSIDERERVKGVPPKARLKKLPKFKPNNIVEVTKPKQTESESLLIKILVQYGEQCHIDGFVEEENIGETSAQIHSLLMDVIGEDEKVLNPDIPRNGSWALRVNRNELRAKQRQHANKLFNKGDTNE